MIARSDLNPSLFSTPGTSLPQRAVSRRDSETIGVSQVLRIRRGLSLWRRIRGIFSVVALLVSSILPGRPSNSFLTSSGCLIGWPSGYIGRLFREYSRSMYSRQSRRHKGSCQARPRPRERPVSYRVPFAALGLNHLEAYKSYETVDYGEVVP